MTKERAVKKEIALKLFRSTYVLIICAILTLIFISGNKLQSYMNKGVDRNINDIVAHRLGKKTNKLTSDDFKNIDSIEISKKICPNLKSLKKMTNLKSISLNNPLDKTDNSPEWLKKARKFIKISKQNKWKPYDLKPLQNLKKLESLSIYTYRLDNINQIGKLDNLKYLKIAVSPDNPIQDLSPLLSITNLQGLNISIISNNIIGPLADFTNLEELELDFLGAPAIDISFLSNLGKLRKLTIYNSQIADISPLSDLSNLENLIFEANGYKDLFPLAKLTKLKSLELASNSINDFGPLAELENLGSGLV